MSDFDQELVAERDALRARVERLADARGVAPRDLDAVTDHLLGHHKLAYVSHIVEDARVEALLMQSVGEKPELFKPKPAPESLPSGVTPELAQKLSPAELRAWPTMNAQARYALKLKAEDRGRERVSLSDEIRVRHGENASMDNLTLSEKHRLAHETAVPQQRPTLVAKHELPGNASKTKAGQMLLGLDLKRAIDAIDRELTSLRASKTTNWNVENARADRIAKLEGQKAFLNDRARIL